MKSKDLGNLSIWGGYWGGVSPLNHAKIFIFYRLKGSESSSQFQWFTIAKIELSLQFLIFFVLILGLRLQRYLSNTKRCPLEKSFWKL